MTERPILFSAPMVRAILDGRKTQTRRIVKLKPGQQVDERDDGSSWPWTDYDGADMWDWLPCPYGKPGDRLWVRETWAWYGCEYIPSDVVYRADTEVLPEEYGRWRPSIHMPRWASRITLEITEVRVERLNDISEADALAEGVEGTSFLEEAERMEPATGVMPGRYAFRALWESIHGADSWSANPWVWVVGFSRVAP